MSRASRDYRARRRSGLLPFLSLLVVVVAGYLLLTDPQVLSGLLPAEQPEAQTQEDPPAGDLLDRITVNDDGSFSATLSEPEVTSLVRRGLTESGAQTIENVSVDLRLPDGAAPGLMDVDGRLSDQGLPVTATVDLDVQSGEIVPTVRDLRVGPVGVPGSVSEELTRQLRAVDFLAEQDVHVDSLSTSDTQLRISGQTGL